MSDEIKDLDDVEAQAWVSVCSRIGTRHADECVRLLRERRSKVPSESRERSKYLSARLDERSQIVAWLRLKDEEDTWAPNSSILGCAADAIERGEHDR